MGLEVPILLLIKTVLNDLKPSLLKDFPVQVRTAMNLIHN